MKKVLVLAAAFALFAAPAFAVVSGTPHDLRAYSPGAQICVFCHTPHGGINANPAPLWNRSAGTVTGVYGGVDINATMPADYTATDASLCISCHDGNLVETLQNEPNTGATSLATYSWTSASANLSSDMTNDHPIGFNYEQAAGLDTEINVIASQTTALPVYGTNGEMWCSTCHDVHDNSNGLFLLINNAGSALCLNCHVK